MIAIISILAAILFPVFARARENARRSSCQSNLKQLALGIHQYSQDYDERLPVPAYHLPGTNYSATANGPEARARLYNNIITSWVDEVYPYIKSDQIFTCPSDTLPNRFKTSSGTGTLGQISYGMNANMNGWSHYNYNPNYPHIINDATYWYIYCNVAGPTGMLPGQSLAKIISPSYKVLLGDIGKGSVYAGTVLKVAQSTYANIYYDWPVAMTLDKSTSFGNTATSTANFQTTGRHLDGANIAFADGHVKWFPPKTPGLQFSDVGTPFTGTCGAACGSEEGIRFWCPYNDGSPTG